MSLFVQILLLTLVTLLFSMISIIYYHRIWNPILVFIGMFFLGVIFAITGSQSLYFKKALFWIIMGETVFIASFILAQICFNRRTSKDYTVNVKYNVRSVNHALTICVFLALFSLLLSIYSVMQVAPNFSSIFLNSTYVRSLYLERSDHIVVTLIMLIIKPNYFIMLCLFPVALKLGLKKVWFRLFLVFGLRLFESLVTMSKELFLIDLVIFISAYILTAKGIKEELKFYKKYSLPLVILICILLVVISFQRNYIGQGRYSSYLDAIIGTIRTYVSVGISAFGDLLNSTLSFTDGQLCFRPVFNILSYFGIGTRISIMQEAAVGNVNVYTAFGNMYRDFSYFGIIILSVFFGALCGVLYNTNYKFRLANIVINSIIMMTMFFGYYDLKIIQTIYPFTMVYAYFFDRFFAKKIYFNTSRKELDINQSLLMKESGF